MNIEELSSRLNAPDVTNTSPKRNKPSSRQTIHEQAKDQVATSILSDILSGQTEALEQLHRPRPSVVARLKADTVADISDSAIDTILDRMIDG